MRWLRLRLAAVTTGWLACQGAGLIAAPIVFTSADPAAIADGLHECCRNLAPGQQCPMHHVPHEEPASPGADEASDGGCAMRSACAPVDAALLALAGTLGLLPPAAALHPGTRAVPVRDRAVSRRLHASLPEFPPPRVAHARS